MTVPPTAALFANGLTGDGAGAGAGRGAAVRAFGRAAATIAGGALSRASAAAAAARAFCRRASIPRPSTPPSKAPVSAIMKPHLKLGFSRTMTDPVPPVVCAKLRPVESGLMPPMAIGAREFGGGGAERSPNCPLP